MIKQVGGNRSIAHCCLPLEYPKRSNCNKKREQVQVLITRSLKNKKEGSNI